MSIDRSLKIRGALKRHRNVLTRAERVEANIVFGIIGGHLAGHGDNSVFCGRISDHFAVKLDAGI